MMIVHSVQCHVVADCTNHTDDVACTIGVDVAASGDDMWKVTVQMTWQGTGGC
jgi:hypothetical protein